MTYSYFPGCTLKNKAKDLDKYARECAKVLGFELEEIPEWQCCGAVYPLASDEIATKLSSVRAPERCKSKGTGFGNGLFRLPHVIKRVNDDMANVEEIRTKVNNYMSDEEPYQGETKVLHYLEVLRDVVGFDKIKEKTVNPLKGRKIGAYYGCMLLRPKRDHAVRRSGKPDDHRRVHPRDRCGTGGISDEKRVLRRLHFPERQADGSQYGRSDHGFRRMEGSGRTDHGMSVVYV